METLVLATRWIKSNERLRFFEPNGAQEKFISLIRPSDSNVRIFSASNAIGKTALVVNIFGHLIWPGLNPFFTGELFKDWPYPKRLRYITDPKLVEEIGPFHSEIEKWWPKGRYEASKGGKNYFSQYKANGWILDVMSYDQDIKQFEGGTFGLIVCDEPPPRSIFNACISRLRMGGLLFVVMTPLTQAAYFYDEVVPNHLNDIVYAQMEDNCIDHGIRGQLKHENIQKMIAEMPQDEVDARAYGKAISLSGLIFKSFDPKVHVLAKHIEVPRGATILQSVDPHSDKPFACIWAMPDPKGNVYIVDEWPNEDFYKMHNCQLTIHDYKKIFDDKEFGWNISKRIIDRHFAQVKSVYNRKNLREEFQDIGLDFQPSYNAHEEESEMETGILKVREYLNYDPQKTLGNLNQPKLYISPNCRNTIASLSRWTRDSKTGKVSEKYKDFCDTVRYLLMEDPQPETPTFYREPVKRYG